jgi:phage virion morphogenesis protein
MATLRLNLSDLPAYLEAKAKGLQDADLTKPLKVIRQLIISDTKMNFVGQHDPDGVLWAPLKSPRNRPRDQRHKNRKTRKGSDKILRDTGMLMNSLTGGSIDEVTTRGLRFGTNLFYGKFHQFGTRKMVARPFLGLNAKLLERSRIILSEHITKLLGGGTP